MEAIIGMVVAVAFIVELRNARRKGQKVAFMAYALYLIAAVLVVLLAFQVDIPNPLDGITFVFKPISSMLEAILR